MVEGDAENILIPVVADILGYPLEKYGISVVNVGSTAFLRYSGIMVRKDGTDIGIPVSVITDCDVRPYDVEPTTKEKHSTRRKLNLCRLKKKETENIQMAPYAALLHLDGRWSIASP